MKKEIIISGFGGQGVLSMQAGQSNHSSVIKQSQGQSVVSQGL